MNYIKKIDKLNQRIKCLEEENHQLKIENKKNESYKKKYEYQIKLAEKKEHEFQELILELKYIKEKYNYLIQKLTTTLRKNNNIYKKAITDISNNLK